MSEACLILCTLLLDPGLLVDLSRRHIPPDIGAWQVGVRDGGNHNHEGTIVVARLFQSRTNLVCGVGANSLCSHTLSHLD